MEKLGLKLVGDAAAKPKEAMVGIEVSMFGAPSTLSMDIPDIGTFQRVLDAMDSQGYIDGIHRQTGRHMRSYRYPGMLILKDLPKSSIIAADTIPKAH